MALSQAQLEQLWIQAGGPRKYATVMAKIAQRESSGQPGVQNLKYPDHSIGLWQINQLAHKGAYGSDQALKDPLTNAKAAVAIFNASKRAGQDPLRPWSTYNPATDIKLIGNPPSTNTRSAATTTTRTIPGQDRSQERASLISNFIGQGGADNPSAVYALASGMRSARDTPAATTTVKSSSPTSGPARGRARGKLLELFWQGQGGIDVDNGRRVPQGFVEGHTDHVHVAARPRQILRIGRMAQQMGLHVGENPRFGGVDPVHTEGSFHYQTDKQGRGKAIDVSGDPALMRKFAHRVARLYRV